jgi:hypothetical protein
VDNFLRTLENLQTTDLDFVIAAGDNFMTHSNRLKPCEGWARIGSGTVRTAEQADLRYELALSPELWGSVTNRLPFFYVLGNHDGEARFGDARGYYGHYPDTRPLSRGARMRHLPDPTRVYHGSRNGDLYFTFTTGDARLIILDVMSGPDDYPARPEDWTLGPDQLRWLEGVLRDNDRTWTFVFIEHLVGGVPGLHTHLPPDADRPEYAYGRGGILSTLDGTPSSEFVGEQALLQELMRENDVQLFFHAHDHVALVGEKLDTEGRGEGVHYVMGGQASSLGPRWIRLPRFRQNTDYDGDGEPDFLSEVNGTAKPGFYRVTVHGSSSAEVAYVSSDAESNGEVVFDFTVLPDGSSTLP